MKYTPLNFWSRNTDVCVVCKKQKKRGDGKQYLKSKANLFLVALKIKFVNQKC